MRGGFRLNLGNAEINELTGIVSVLQYMQYTFYKSSFANQFINPFFEFSSA